MSEAVIRVNRLGKRYLIGGKPEAYATLRDTLGDAAWMPLRAIRSLWQRNRQYPKKGSDPLTKGQTLFLEAKMEAFWALQDVSFDVQRGEVVGIIGRNGAGKSTLLKILSRITEPTEGLVTLQGRVGSLLEVGTGFHPELTGRDNVYLNGAILGMNRTEIRRKFDEIVEFAEVERFIDTPVKHYSSGMYLRLAFAVAAHLEPDILIVDEVLAVGDARFQDKCLGKMRDVATQQKRTVLFVSHNMGAIQRLCQWVLWLDGGKITAQGEPKKIVTAYLNSTKEGFDQARAAANSKFVDLSIEKVVLRNGDGEPATNLESSGSVAIELHYLARRRIERPYFWIGIESQFGSLCGANMLLDGIRPEFLEGKGVLTCVFSELTLLPQVYTLSLGVRDNDATTILVPATEIGFFSITGLVSDIGLDGEVADLFAPTASPLLVPYEWRLPDGRCARFQPGLRRRMATQPRSHESQVA